jgi:hypothetical protein
LTPGEHVIATGAGPGHEPVVNVYDAGTGALVGSFEAYDPRFKGGVNVAVADMNGDGIPDIITGPGPGGGPDVRVFDGTTGAIIREFYAYDPAFGGGVNVAAGSWGNIVPPGSLAPNWVRPTIITGPGPGGGPHVKVFGAGNLNVLRSFYAYDPRFTGGVRVANGDFDLQDAVGQLLTSDVITAPGPGGGPDVRIFSGADGLVFANAPGTLKLSFMAYDPNFTGGVFIVSGYLDNSGHVQIITGPGAGGGPDVRIFRSTDGFLLREFEAFDSRFAGGVRVGFVQEFNNTVNGGETGQIITGAGPGGGPHVRVFDALSLALLSGFYAYETSFAGGVFVGGGS